MFRALSALLLVATPAFSVTFNKDIAPIVFRNCSPCHHSGGIGPFPLLTFSDVEKHASQIVAVTQSRFMPPWPPAPGYGDFAGDRSLTPQQIRLFADWVQQNKPEGRPSDLPPAPSFTSDWQLGPPDLVLKMDAPFVLPAAGADIFRNFILPSGLKQTRYVRGFELRMSNPRVVHHANVVLDRTRSLRKRDGEDGQPGFSGMDVITEAAANNFDPDSHFLFYKPGSVPSFEPSNMAWSLDPDTDLVLNLHLQPTGKPEKLQGEIGLYFTDQPPTLHPMLIQLEHDGAIRIPPGSQTFGVADSLVLPVAVKLLAIYPHAHYLGKRFDAWATLPDGRHIPLIRILDWDINWQAVYQYKQPVLLPKGTRLEIHITYDNSAANPRNPYHPPRLVTEGDRSQDEMGHVWFQVLPVAQANANQDPRMALQEAVMRRRLEKYPADFLAHYNLAALMQTMGRIPEAITYYRSAISVKPSSSTAHNGLAAALLVQGNLSDAIPELRKAIECDPTYMSAHYNLARALAATGALSESASEFRTVVTADPQDAAAFANLGTVEFKLRNYSDSLRDLRTAANLNPLDPDLQTNLGMVLALNGDLTGAQHAFETALKLNPSETAAQKNLEIVRAKLAQ